MPSISLDLSSPFDLPRLVEAQDPPADDPELAELLADSPTAPEGEAASEDPVSEDPISEDSDLFSDAEPESTISTSEKLVQEIETGPAANWQQYLQPILKDIKTTVQVPIELRNSYMVPYAKDPDLGFHITGEVVFLEAVPPEFQDLPQGVTLRYNAYVSPDGELARTIDLIYLNQKPIIPDYYSNPNVLG